MNTKTKSNVGEKRRFQLIFVIHLEGKSGQKCKSETGRQELKQRPLRSVAAGGLAPPDCLSMLSYTLLSHGEHHLWCSEPFCIIHQSRKWPTGQCGVALSLLQFLWFDWFVPNWQRTNQQKIVHFGLHSEVLIHHMWGTHNKWICSTLFFLKISYFYLV